MKTRAGTSRANTPKAIQLIVRPRNRGKARLPKIFGRSGRGAKIETFPATGSRFESRRRHSGDKRRADPHARTHPVGEFFGGLGLVVGFLTRFSAAALIVTMLGAIGMVHGKNGFFLSGDGFEYNLALIGLLAPTLIAGPGWYAVGRCLPLPKKAVTGRPVAALE